MPEYRKGPEAKEKFGANHANTLSGYQAHKAEAESRGRNRIYFTQCQTP